jgi:hypothetical protein
MLDSGDSGETFDAGTTSDTHDAGAARDTADAGAARDAHAPADTSAPGTLEASTTVDTGTTPTLDTGWAGLQDAATPQSFDTLATQAKHNAVDHAIRNSTPERQAELDAREAELEMLRRDKTLADLTANFLGRSYDEVSARQAAEALADGDTNALFDIMARRDMAYEKALRAKILAETPKPPASDPNSEEAKRKDKENLRRLFGLPSNTK